MAALWHATRVCPGVELMLLGVTGTLLPVIPGLPLFLAGTAILGTEHPVLRPFLTGIQGLQARWRR